MVGNYKPVVAQTVPRLENTNCDIGRPPFAGRVLLLAPLLATMLVYLPVLWYEFVSDDRYQIVGNPHITSWYFLPRFFTGHVWSHVEPSIPVNHYRPVFLVWLRVNHMLFGFAPWGWHLTLVGIHLMVTFLVFLLARRISSDEWVAGIAALVFSLHPVHIESVAWVSGASDPLAATFLIAAFLCYFLRAERNGRWDARLAVSWLLYALALLSKETAVILPFIIFTYEWIFGARATEASCLKNCQKRLQAALWPAVPYVVLSGVYLVARGFVLKGLAHVETVLPLSTLALTLPSVLWFYIKHLLWPVALNGMYELPYVSRPDLAHFWLPLTAVVVMAAGLEWSAARSKQIAFAASWLVFPILPVLDPSFQPKDNLVHDRFLYIPSVGLALMAGLAWRELEKSQRKIFERRMTRLIPVAVLTGLLAGASMLQSGYWKNDLLLVLVFWGRYNYLEQFPLSLGHDEGVLTSVRG